MKAPDLYLAVYMGYCYAESIPIVKTIRKCGFTTMTTGSQLSSDELYDLECFWNGEWYLGLNLTNNRVTTLSDRDLGGNVFLVDVADMKKAISYKRLDGGKGKGPGHFELSKLFAMSKYSKIQSQYKKWCEEWYERQVEKAKQIEEDRIRKIFEEEERKKREEEARIAEEKRIRENMIYIQREREEERRWKESARYKELEEEAYQRSLSWNGWGKDDYHDGGN